MVSGSWGDIRGAVAAVRMINKTTIIPNNPIGFLIRAIITIRHSLDAYFA